MRNKRPRLFPAGAALSGSLSFPTLGLPPQKREEVGIGAAGLQGDGEERGLDAQLGIGVGNHLEGGAGLGGEELLHGVGVLLVGDGAGGVGQDAGLGHVGRGAGEQARVQRMSA